MSYLHGFSEKEADRLQAQAAVVGPRLLMGLDWPAGARVLDLGCAVGAMTARLAEARPDLTIVAVDGAEVQVAAARGNLAGLDRVEVVHADARSLPFPASHFDGVFCSWLLEHVPDPPEVLAEAFRVTSPGGLTLWHEVFNALFFLEPYGPSLWRYWTAYCEWQDEHAGDPWVGAKLGALLEGVGATGVETQTRVWHLDRRTPDERREKTLFWRDMIESAAPRLLDSGLVDEGLVEGMRADFDRALSDPDSIFYAGFIAARALAPS